MRFIGDIHGKFSRYENLIKNSDASIQVGDFGLGFDKVRSEKIISKLNETPDHRFIRGNHDNPSTCKSSPNWIADGKVENNMMFIGGAWSIDHAWRTEGVDIWKDEELSYLELDALIDVYSIAKPEIMITHDCPLPVSHELFVSRGGSLGGYQQQPTRTGKAFEIMHAIHQPQLWIFGHWHVSRNEIVGNTRFICLKELEWMDINIENFEITQKGQG